MRPQHGTVPTGPPFPSRRGERCGDTQHLWVTGTPRPPCATANLLLLLPPEIDEDRLPNPLLKVGAATRRGAAPAPRGAPQHPVPAPCVPPPSGHPPPLALQSGLAMSPRQRKKVSRTTPTMKGTSGGGGDGPLGDAGDTLVAWLWPAAVPPPWWHGWGHGDTGTQGRGLLRADAIRGAKRLCHRSGTGTGASLHTGATPGTPRGLGDAAVPSKAPLAALQSCR